MSSQGESSEMMKFMTESAYTCTEEWLVACVEWVKDNYSKSQRTSTFLKKELYGQWLDANLTEMESSCLPPDLINQRVKILKGRFGLQINSIQDIGESCYSQYSKLKKLENENTNVSATDGNQVMQSWQPKSRRCLYMSLTDGCQQIFGMELLPIPALSLSLKLGAKVIIWGPVECRLGVLLLKPAQISLLGGEIESLVIANSQENILSRNLNHQNAETLPAPARGSQLTNVGTNPTTNSSLSTQAFPNDFDEDDDIFMEIDENLLLGQTQTQNIPTQNLVQNQSQRNISQPQYQSTQQVAGNISNAGFRQPPPSQSQTQSQVASSSQRNSRFQPPPVVGTNSGSNSIAPVPALTNKGFKNARVEIGKQQKISSYLKPIPTKISAQTFNTGQPNQSEVTSLDTEVITLDNSGNYNSDVTEMCDTHEEEPVLVHCEPEGNSKSPYQYIRQINQGIFRDGEVVKVKAIISTLVSNIKAVNGQWTISVNINDGSGYLVAKISSQVLDGIIGFSPSEMKQIKISKSAQSKASIVNGMRNLTTTLVHLNAILCIRVGHEEPLITGIEDLTEYHVTELRKRVCEGRTCTL